MNGMGRLLPIMSSKTVQWLEPNQWVTQSALLPQKRQGGVGERGAVICLVRLPVGHSQKIAVYNTHLSLGGIEGKKDQISLSEWLVKSPPAHFLVRLRKMLETVPESPCLPRQ